MIFIDEDSWEFEKHLDQTLGIATYEQMKSELEKMYPRGHYLGISKDNVLADATKCNDLIAKLKKDGVDPEKVYCSSW